MNILQGELYFLSWKHSPCIGLLRSKLVLSSTIPSNEKSLFLKMKCNMGLRWESIHWFKRKKKQHYAVKTSKMKKTTQDSYFQLLLIPHPTEGKSGINTASWNPKKSELQTSRVLLSSLTQQHQNTVNIGLKSHFPITPVFTPTFYEEVKAAEVLFLAIQTIVCGSRELSL